jgi:PIN domain nuclease of toxin-antitoxin system
VRYLLDTHALLWICLEQERLSRDVVELLLETDADVFVSSVSITEIAIKHSQGKHSAPPISGREAYRLSLESGFPSLPYTHDHAAALDRLPWLHRDPFDRMLIAQALVDDLILISRDAEFDRYGVPLLRC